MKSVSFLRNSWKKKEGKPLASLEETVPSKRASRATLPRTHADDIQAIISSLDFPITDDDDSIRAVCQEQENEQKFNMLTARQRSRSMGAQYTSPDIVPQLLTEGDDLGSFVRRPPRKSSLAPMPDSIRYAGVERPAFFRTSSASSLQLRASRTLQPKRSMPELDIVCEDEGVELTRGDRVSKRRSRADSILLNQRFSSLPASPAPSPTPNAQSITSPENDSASPRKSRLRTEVTSSISRPSTASSLAYDKDEPENVSPLREQDDLAHISCLTPPPENARPSTAESSYSEDTLSLFPQPPPLNLRNHFAPSPVPLQFPVTPDYTPAQTPTGATFFQSSSTHHVRRASPPMSILKKPSGYFHSLPSPPITPSTSSTVSRRTSRGSFQMMSPEPVAPTLKIRNSSPHMASAKAHNAHRPTSSDSCSAYSVSSERTDYYLRKRALSRPEVATLFEAHQAETQAEMESPSLEPDCHGVQWGYAV
ncbi:hypothetical protein PILCRDRAFT_811135 [Piloderma croceum F 1598]|uniref:Uncharacterized protein n=1 Tax=Piloderma croceum (strain F 1598) TaxID=765440 RepID=A0A0C3GG87_PILCF|nr:hypothetical protein PILCRDRAFT_811135 [Piloderma croceum F 1598]